MVRLRKKSSIIANLYFENEKSKRKCRDLEKKLKCLESKPNAAIQKGKWPKFIRAFQHAANNGNLPTHQLQNLLEDIAKSLQGKHKWHADSKSFYTCLLNIGSPAVTNFVSKNLLGLDLGTVKKDRAKRTQEIQRGRVRKNIEHVAGLLEQYHLKDVPCCVVEDATTVITRIDITLKQNADGVEEVWADGFSEPLKVTKLQDLQDYFDEHKDESIARYVYVWTLVPQVPSAPYFPVFWAANNNKFDSTWVRDWWEYTTKECEQCEIPLIGFNSDGDSRLRKNDYEVLFHADTERLHVKAAEGTPHPFMYLSVGKIHNTFLLGGQDYFHVQMRVRRHLLDLKRKLALGPWGLARASHLEGCPHLHRNDTMFSDKQNWDGVLRLFDMRTVGFLHEKAKDDPRFKATEAYVYFGFRLLRMITGDNQTLEGKSEAELNVIRSQAPFPLIPSSPSFTLTMLTTPTTLTVLVMLAISMAPTVLTTVTVLHAYHMHGRQWMMHHSA